jgi:hypothetical protein
MKTFIFEMTRAWVTKFKYHLFIQDDQVKVALSLFWGEQVQIELCLCSNYQYDVSNTA